MNHLLWFRNDLRTVDNTSLREAVKSEATVIAVYCFDPRKYQQTAFGFKKTGNYRAQFLIETIENLQKNLEKLNITLLIYQETPETVIPKLLKEHKINRIFLQKEWTAEEQLVSEALKKSTDASIKWQECYDQFLFHPEDIPFDDFNEIPKVFTDFRKKCEKQCQILQPLKAPAPLPKSNLLTIQTKIPTFTDLGLQSFERDPRSAFPFKGGEDAGWERMENYIWKTQNLKEYKHTRNGLVGTGYSSKFSAWLANGSISARSIYCEVKKFEQEVTKNQDTYWMIFELIWRDFFKYISLKHGDAIFKIGGILEKEYQWKAEADKKEDWIHGKTKYDFVNANMIEIALTGWMSNRGRQNVASFWAKEMEQDWRIGASYFESLLIDYDVHSNWGNWMYNAGVGNDPRDRKFNIEKQANDYDPNQEFIDLWLKN